MKIKVKSFFLPTYPNFLVLTKKQHDTTIVELLNITFHFLFYKAQRSSKHSEKQASKFVQFCKASQTLIFVQKNCTFVFFVYSFATWKIRLDIR